MSMLFGGLIIGIGSGVGSAATIDAITGGFGNTCKNIGLVIIFGTILGTYLEKSNSCQRIATSLLKLTGEKNASVALAATGYLVSIPVFSDVALIMLSPIIKAISKKTGKPYDFTRFYAVPSRHSDKVRGIRVENVDIWNGEYAPDISDIHPDDYVDISYGRGGFCRRMPGSGLS